MLLTDHKGQIDAIACFFTHLLADRLEHPSSWKSSKIIVLFKSGETSEAKNYRPVTIIPVMAKLFSGVLYGRIQAMIDARLSQEQFGFRKGQGCSDAVHIVRTVIEKSAEWGEELWVAALDVEKVFDRLHHAVLFDALAASGIDSSVAASLRRLYRGMKASVKLDSGVDSRHFRIERGVRQGDPLSPLLFNLIINRVLAEVSPTWRRRGYGTNVGRDVFGARLTHVMFADDMTLIARSWTSMKRMLQTLREALARVGLRLHPGKCKVQNNLPTQVARRAAVDDDFVIELVPADVGFKFLGTMLHLVDASKHEISNRIAAAWRMFWGMKKLLMNREISMTRRLRLFESTVTSCLLWCCESWTPRVLELRELVVARHRMLRRIAGQVRLPEEEYVAWIRRTTQLARAKAETAGLRDWSHSHFQKKLSWAGRIARSDVNKWLFLVTTWHDSAWEQVVAELGPTRPRRPSTRRWMKFEDELRRYCAAHALGSWTRLALDRREWDRHRIPFCFFSQ